MKFQDILFSYCFFFFGIKVTEKPCDDLLRTVSVDGVLPEQADDLGGVCQIQCETEALEEVIRYCNST